MGKPTVAAQVAVAQRGVRRVCILVNGQILPLGNVVVGNARIVGGIRSVTSLVCNNGHGLDTDHSLQSQVGLIPKWRG